MNASSPVRKYIAMLVCASALAGIIPRAVSRDEAAIANLTLSFMRHPVHILSDSATVAEFKRFGYVSTMSYARRLSAFFNECCRLVRMENLRYIEGEIERRDRLIEAAFHTPPLNDLDGVLEHPEWIPIYHEIMARDEAVRQLLYAKKCTPELLAMIERTMEQQTAIGCEEYHAYEYETIAEYYYIIGEDETALGYLEKALEGRIAYLRYPMICQDYGRIGVHHERKGRLAAADSCFEQCRVYAERMGDPHYIARAHAFLASLRCAQGYFAEAEELLTRAVEISSRLEDPISRIQRLIDLSQFYQSVGEYVRSITIAEEATHTASRYLDDPSNKFFTVIQNAYVGSLAQGLAIQSRGQEELGNREAAINTMREALRIAAPLPDRHFYAELERSLGDLLAGTGRTDEARERYRSALEVSRDLKERSRECEYLAALGRLSLVEKKYGDAENDLSRARAIAREERLWMEEVRILSALAEARERQGAPEEARRLLLECIETYERESAAANQSSAIHALSREMDDIFARLMRIECDNGRRPDSLAAIAERARHLASGARHGRARWSSAAIAARVSDRRWIRENAVVISHVVCADRIVIIAMAREGTSYRQVPYAEPKIEEDIRAFASACSGTESPLTARSANRTRAITEEARRLYGILLAPVEQLVASHEVICFVPHAALYELPFGTLVIPGDGSRFLAETKTIIVAPDLLTLSGAARREGLERRPPFSAPLLVGGAEIAPRLERLYPSLADLPNAGLEVDAVRRHFRSPRILTGPRATKKNVVGAFAASDLVHIATHSVQYPVQTGRSALVLSPEPRGAAEAPIDSCVLTDEEISRLDLGSVRLAVLSSCQSACARQCERREGPGLAGAFVLAGVGSTVASLSPVEDAAARELITAFYRELMRNEGDPAAALGRVQRQIIAEDAAAGDRAKRISLWAPFVVVGSFEDREGGKSHNAR